MVSTKRLCGSVFGGWLLATIVACSGGISTVGGDGGAGSSGTSGGSSGTSGASSGSGGDTSCNVASTAVTRACMPGTAAAGVPITVQAEGEDTGCLGCGKSLEPCSVQVVGQKITIGLALKTCSLPPETAFPAICAVGVGTCTIPPLAEGSYSIELAGGVKSSADFVRQLVVKNGGGETSCSLTQGTTTPTIESDGFADTCSIDDDCALVTEGDVCQPCACPNEAIAKSGLEAYQSKVRALQSQCKSTGGAPSCAPCPERKARCTGGKCNAVSVTTGGG